MTTPAKVTAEHLAIATAALGGLPQYEAHLFRAAQAIADAEARGKQRGREAERADVIEWLRGVGQQYMDGDMKPCDEFTGEAYEQAAGEIERGEHLTK